MKIKWVCPVCSTTNICEKTERMRCFVCGSYYEEGPHISESSHISESPHLPEREDLTSADVSAAKPRGREKLNNFIKRIKSSLGLKETDRLKRSSEIYSGKSSADVRSFIPWPEHRIVFDMEKLNATGCVNVERTEVSGSKYYKLTYRNGTERIMNIPNLKLVGYVRDM